MKKLVLGSLGLSLLLVLRWHPAAAEQPLYRVIAHPENPVTSLTRTQASKYLLKQISKWDNGMPAEPVDQSGQGAVREAFTQEIHDRSVASIRRYWQRQVFSGRQIPPPEVGDDAQVMEYVRNRPGAIGYVSASTRLDGVKALRIVAD